VDPDLEQLKQHFPLLDYLLRHNWTPCRRSIRQEFVGLCPLHGDTRPSFYVNACRNLFYCHGCGQGGDLIRFVELFLHVPFRQSVAHLQRELASVARSATATELLARTADYYQLELHRHPEAVRYLESRGLRDFAIIEELGIGYAPGGSLRRHLTSRGYSSDLLRHTGLIGSQGRDTFCRRVIIPCRQDGQIVNLYGRSIGAAFPHRLLPRSRGGLFAWESVRHSSSVILVEGLFDLALLWQSGFRNTTSALGTHLTSAQLDQLCGSPDRLLYIAFDQDENHAGQQASQQLARRLKCAGGTVHIVRLPAGHDPNSYFFAGATAADFAACLRGAQRL
jgi:DNA primase